MKISRAGNKRKKQLTLISQSTREDLSEKRLAQIEKVQAYLTMTQPQFLIAMKKYKNRLDDMKIKDGISAGLLIKSEK
jgi:hypothetical protein